MGFRDFFKNIFSRTSTDIVDDQRYPQKPVYRTASNEPLIVEPDQIPNTSDKGKGKSKSKKRFSWPDEFILSDLMYIWPPKTSDNYSTTIHRSIDTMIHRSIDTISKMYVRR